MKVLFISAVIVIIDQATKLLVKGINIPFLNLHSAGLTRGYPVPILGNFFNLTFVENPGIAFGISFGAKYKLLISIITLLASLALLIYLYINRKRELSLRISLAFILGGAFGNLIDRIFYGLIYGYAPLFYGKVVDFFDLKFLNFFIFNESFGHYVFNFADVSVTAGVILLLFTINKRKVESDVPASSIQHYLADNKE